MQFNLSAKTKKLISMTPLIDVVFLLLIFFMLTTSFINQHGINLQVPEKDGAKSSWKNAILIRPDKDNTIRINTDKIALADLADRLKPMLDASSSKKIIVQPYNGVKLQTMVSVLDVARSSGALSISLLK